ncbi:MAG: hypothetical protein NVS2B16_06460 [Chloroflexota bacterium]
MHLPLRWRPSAFLYVLRRLLLLVLFLVLGFFVYGAYQVHRLYDDVSKTVAVIPRSTIEPTVVPSAFDGTQRINVLVLGSDNDKKKEEARPLSQSMIVVSIDPVHDKVTLLSIPRDFWVPIRGHGMGKIDLAYKYGGVQLARETVEKLLHIGIDYYAWVGLGGFIRVINTFNGVTLNVSHPILDDFYPNDLNTVNPYGKRRVFIPAGWQHMDGDAALQYVRSRHGDRIGDFGRSARQQQVLLQLRSKATTFNLLTKVFSIADTLRASVRTDVQPSDYMAVERLSRRIRPQDVHQVVLSFPYYCAYGWRSGQSVLLPYWSRIYPLTRQIFARISLQGGGSSHGRTGVRHAIASPTLQPRRTATGGATPPVPSPVPTAVPTPAPPHLNRLPGTVFFIKSGNLFRLSRGGKITQLTRTGDVEMPALSPKGDTIALVRSPAFAYASDIWLLNLRTGRMRRVTHDTNPARLRELSNNLWAAWPSWSSDGSRLYFSYDGAKLALPATEARPVDLSLYSMPSAGGSPVRLTQPALGAGGDTEPAARPGSSQVAFVHWDYNQTTNEPYSQLYLYDPRSSSPTVLTAPSGRILDPAWDAHGKRIAFVRKTNGVDEIAVADVVTGAKGTQLGARRVLARGKVGQPAFTPDGRWVSFVRAQDEGFALFVAPVSGGNALQIQDVGASVDGRWRPVWRG